MERVSNHQMGASYSTDLYSGAPERVTCIRTKAVGRKLISERQAERLSTHQSLVVEIWLRIFFPRHWQFQIQAGPELGDNETSTLSTSKQAADFVQGVPAVISKRQSAPSHGKRQLFTLIISSYTGWTRRDPRCCSGRGGSQKKLEGMSPRYT
jgi:hypothetical protein